MASSSSSGKRTVDDSRLSFEDVLGLHATLNQKDDTQQSTSPPPATRPKYENRFPVDTTFVYCAPAEGPILSTISEWKQLPTAEQLNDPKVCVLSPEVRKLNGTNMGKLIKLHKARRAYMEAMQEFHTFGLAGTTMGSVYYTTPAQKLDTYSDAGFEAVPIVNFDLLRLDAISFSKFSLWNRCLQGKPLQTPTGECQVPKRDLWKNFMANSTIPPPQRPSQPSSSSTTVTTTVREQTTTTTTTVPGPSSSSYSLSGAQLHGARADIFSNAAIAPTPALGTAPTSAPIAPTAPTPMLGTAPTPAPIAPTAPNPTLGTAPTTAPTAPIPTEEEDFEMLGTRTADERNAEGFDPCNPMLVDLCEN